MAQEPRLSGRKKLIFGLICLAVSLLAAEGVHRLLSGQRYAKQQARFDAQGFYAEHPVLPYVLRPGRYANQSPGWQAVAEAYRARGETAPDFVFHVNQHLLRGPPVLENPGLRLLCVGASTTFGTGCAADSLTYPGQLEQRLQARFPDRGIEVLNAGVPRYRSSESILNLRRLAELEPDFVLVYHAINDIVWCDDSVHYADPEGQPRPLTRLEKMRLQAGSFLLEDAWNRLTGVYPEKSARGTGYLNYPQSHAVFERNIRRLVSLSRELGAQPVLLTFATRLRDDLSAAQREEVVGGVLFTSYFPDYPSLDAALKKYNGMIREVATAEGVPLIDLEGTLPSDARYWTDFCHLTDEGTRLMIDQLEPGMVVALESWLAGQ